VPVAEPDTEELLRRVAGGDAAARGSLLHRHRHRLTRMIAVRLDRRLAARLDPSDVVQETLTEADRRLDAYLKKRPLPFYPWLRQIAADRLADKHRRHIGAARRTVRRERLPDESERALADELLDRAAGPSEAARRAELQRRVRSALGSLSSDDRNVLMLRHLEQLPVREVAEILGVSEAAAKVRHLRAIQRLRSILSADRPGGQV
jgi:RNA polymerase sigma-70 factor (ECF subfamily)